MQRPLYFNQVYTVTIYLFTRATVIILPQNIIFFMYRYDQWYTRLLTGRVAQPRMEAYLPSFFFIRDTLLGINNLSYIYYIWKAGEIRIPSVAKKNFIKGRSTANCKSKIIGNVRHVFFFKFQIQYNIYQNDIYISTVHVLYRHKTFTYM